MKTAISEFMTVLDSICKSDAAKYSASLNSNDPAEARAARIYHALADVRDAVQYPLPDGVYESLDNKTKEAISNLAKED